MNEEFVKSMPKLGFGMMRLPMAGDEIDLEQTCRMVDEFMAHGYTYFDTAYSYGDGANEIAVRQSAAGRHGKTGFLRMADVQKARVRLCGINRADAHEQRIFGNRGGIIFAQQRVDARIVAAGSYPFQPLQGLNG